MQSFKAWLQEAEISSLIGGFTSFTLHYLVSRISLANVGSLTSNIFPHPATKQEKLLQKRYAEFLKYPAVTKAITLPLVLPSTHGQSKSELTFSVSDGMKWKVRKNIEGKQVYIPLDFMEYLSFTFTVDGLYPFPACLRGTSGNKSRRQNTVDKQNEIVAV